ncbi:MAG: J domain-containing protein [Acetobacteraceae bacterium]
MTSDPLGYYARLGVAPDSAPAELKAAFRRQARRLHPDARGTGDAGGFVRLKEAYDVLADPVRRAAYHRAMAPAPAAPVEPPRPPLRGIWLALAAASVIGAVVAGVAVRPAPAPTARVVPPPLAAPAVPPATALKLAGPADHYVLPAGEAIVWRIAPDGALSRIGALAPFDAVHVASQPAPEGLVGVAFEGGLVGFVDAARLMAGNASEARRERCAYSAGAPPANGEVLTHGGHGDAGLALANASASPAVVTLRDPAGGEAERVFLAPGGTVRLAGLAGGPWTAEAAFGELWSRACMGFVAGERVMGVPGQVARDGTLRIAD